MGAMVQEIEGLPSKYQALSSNPNTTKKPNQTTKQKPYDLCTATPM
jgi:hypothetical protein